MKVVRVFLYCLLGGLPLTVAALGTGNLAYWWLAGIVLAASFVPVAIFGPRRLLGQFAVIAPVILVVTVLCLWSEALIIIQAPEIQQHALRNLMQQAVFYIVPAAVLAILAVILKLPRADGSKPASRSAGKTAILVVVCGLAYFLYYLVFGGLTYQYFTKVYYPDAPRLVARLGFWFWLIQLARGILMTLAVLPIIRTLRMSRMQAALSVGLLLWIAGGLTPLLLPNPLMSPTARFIHVIEIFTQNFPLGLTAVLLLRPQQTGNETKV